MKTITVNLYSFNELSQAAKEKVIQEIRNNNPNDYDYIWNDAHKTVKEFHKIFPTKEGLNSWLDYKLTNFDYEDEILNLSGLRLRKYILNNFGSYLFKAAYKGSLKTNDYVSHKRIKSPLELNSVGNRFNPYYSAIFKDNSCVLTGVCYDDDLLNPIYKFLESDYKNESINLKYLFDECFHSLKKSIESEIEWNESDEGIKDFIESNDYEFTEEGGIY
jgi:hypothetical protein